MYKRHELGIIGEKLARNYLEKEGYKILECNFSCKRGEIDIIALDKKEIVFVEVKTRGNMKYGKPAEAVNNTKQKHIYKTANYYLYIKNLQYRYTRIDVIEIYVKNKKYKINHIKQAF